MKVPDSQEIRKETGLSSKETTEGTKEKFETTSGIKRCGKLLNSQVDREHPQEGPTQTKEGKEAKEAKEHTGDTKELKMKRKELRYAATKGEIKRRQLKSKETEKMNNIHPKAEENKEGATPGNQGVSP